MKKSTRQQATPEQLQRLQARLQARKAAGQPVSPQPAVNPAPSAPAQQQTQVPTRWEKGNVSNLISLALLITGLWGRVAEVTGSEWVLAVGLFGFAGGATNWLAVKMLFDRVPLLYGSGVIPARFRAIREAVKDAIMRYFFDEEYLERFFDERMAGDDVGEKVQTVLASDEVDAIIDRKLEELADSPQGMMLQLVGTQTVKPLVKQFVIGFGSEIAPLLADEASVDVSAMRAQVDGLLETKLEELTPDRVKEMMEEVIREHLGWLIVWGNVFGGTIGLLSKALGY